MKITLQEIETRLAAINTQLDNETDPAKIDELGAEAAKLVEQRGFMKGSEVEMRRAEARKAFEQPQEKPTGGELTYTKRQALELTLGLKIRNKQPSDIQKRALDVSLTTTATTYVEATSMVDGVNNAGLLIPTKILYDFLKEEGKLSPITGDILLSSIKGLVSYPYRASRTKAKAKAEGAATGANQIEFAELTLVKGYLQIIIDVTEEVMALTDLDLGAYILETIANDLSEDWSEDFIYGTGNANRVRGITNGALTTGISAYTNVLKALEDGVKLLTGKARRGAKIYVAQDVYDSIAFAKDDNSNYLYPVVNNTTGVRSFGNLPVFLDENLKAGDFVIGNVSKFYKVNVLRDIKLEHEKEIKPQIHTFTAGAFIAAAPFPNSFAFGSAQ